MSPIRLQLHTICLPLLLTLAFSQSALRADTIYTNFDADGSYAPGAGLIVTNDAITGASIAVAFTPSANYNLTSLEFFASNLIPPASGDSNDITLSIFADNGGLPDSTPIESFSAPVTGMFGDNLLVTTVSSLLQPLLLANTQYWVGMNAAPRGLFIWNQDVTSASGFAETDGLGNWSAADPFQPQGALEIDGTYSLIQPAPVQPDDPLPGNFVLTNSLPPSVPEPSVWSLMAGGLAALILLKKFARFPHHKQ